jgi:lysophospholipase L1-like esterase
MLTIDRSLLPYDRSFANLPGQLKPTRLALTSPPTDLHLTISRSAADRQLYAPEAADPDCLDPRAAAALLHDAPWRRVVVLGDSVALGVREPVAGFRDLAWADRVGEALGRGRTGFAQVNFGTRDLRVAEVRDRQLALALELVPDLALVAVGGNDALRRSFEPRRVRAELIDLLTPLADAGALVVTLGLFDLARSGLVPAEFAPELTERFDRLDEITAEVTAALGGLHVDGHHHPRSRDPGIYASDRMHCNARGHAIAAAGVVRALAGAIR